MTAQTSHTVYGLQDPRNEEVRYIGCTDDVRGRYISHISGREKNTAKNEWIQELKSLDMLPALIILEEGLRKPRANTRERHWVVWYTRQGARLTNSRIPIAIPVGEAPRRHTIETYAAKDQLAMVEDRLDTIEAKLDQLIGLMRQTIG